jgi:outer membrane lipoprotein SlyB
MDYYHQEFYMIKRLLVVAVAAVTLAGCANESMSGDVYSSSQAKQVQNVTYGTLVSVRPVKIHRSSRLRLGHCTNLSLG